MRLLATACSELWDFAVLLSRNKLSICFIPCSPDRASISSTVPLVCHVYYHTLKLQAFRKALRNICRSFQPDTRAELLGTLLGCLRPLDFQIVFCLVRFSCYHRRPEEGGVSPEDFWYDRVVGEMILCAFILQHPCKSRWVLELCVDSTPKISVLLFPSGRSIVQRAGLGSEPLIPPGHISFSAVSVCDNKP